MKVAVIGGGIFGCTAAIHAAREGHKVTLFEKNAGILSAASGINHYRLHRGYHYPRSPKTAKECKQSLDSFMEEYGGAVVETGDHVYAVAKDFSHVTGTEFLSFCDDLELPYTLMSPWPLMVPDAIDVAVKVQESHWIPQKLSHMVADRLSESGVDVKCGKAFNADPKDYDCIVIAAYAGMGDVHEYLGLEPPELHFKLCENIVAKMPREFTPAQLIVMDGDFGCIDAYGDTGLYVLGHVSRMTHWENIGDKPEIPAQYQNLLNRVRPVAGGPCKWPEILDGLCEFVPLAEEAEYCGSFYTVRAVLPDMQDTDARPTLVEKLNGNVIRILSGKVGTCVDAARSTLSLLGSSHGRRGVPRQSAA